MKVIEAVPGKGEAGAWGGLAAGAPSPARALLGGPCPAARVLGAAGASRGLGALLLALPRAALLPGSTSPL